MSIREIVRNGILQYELSVGERVRWRGRPGVVIATNIFGDEGQCAEISFSGSPPERFKHRARVAEGVITVYIVPLKDPDLEVWVPNPAIRQLVTPHGLCAKAGRCVEHEANPDLEACR